MALITRYVNTASTSGGDGTTNAITGPNRAHRTLNNAEAAEQGDLVAAGNSLEILCSGGADVSYTSIAGWTLDASHTITVKMHPDFKNTSGVFDDSKYHLKIPSSWSNSFYITQGWVTLDGIQSSPTASNSTGLRYSATDGGTVVFKNCIVKGSGANGQVGLNTGASGSNGRVVNNVVSDFVNYGIRKQAYFDAGSSVSFYNNTVNNCGTGLYLGSFNTSNVRAVNNLLTNNTTADFDAPSAATYSSNNVTSDGTSPDAGFSSKVVAYTDAAGGDFSTSDSDIVGLGSDLSADSYYSFSADILGVDRGASWDIGAFQSGGGGGGLSLAVDSLTQGQTVGASSLTVFSSLLAVNGLIQEANLTAPDLAQAFILTANPLSQSQSADAISLIQAHSINVDGTAQSQTSSIPNLLQHSVLNVDSALQNNSASTPALLVAGSLAIESIGQNQTIESPLLLQHAQLLADSLGQSQALEVATISQISGLIVQAVEQAQALGQTSLDQHHALDVSNVLQAAGVDAALLSVMGQITPATMTQAQAVEAAILAQNHLLNVDGLAQVASVENTTLDIKTALSVLGVNQSQGLDNTSLSTLNVLSVDSLTQEQIADLVRFGGTVIGYLKGEIVIYNAVNGSFQTVH